MRSVKHSKCLMGWDSLPKYFRTSIARLKTIFFILLLLDQKTSSSYYNRSLKSQLVHVHVQDGNGFINRQELAVVMGNLGESLTQEEIQVYLGRSLKLSTPPAFDNNQNWKISHPRRESGLLGSLKMSTPSTSCTTCVNIQPQKTLGESYLRGYLC